MTSDASARRDAIVRTDESIVLRASAGTGKTTILVERLVTLLVRDNLDPELLVAITFTEMAAAEMKVRLRRRLMDAWKWGAGEFMKKGFDESIEAMGQEEVLKRARAALDKLDRAAIETIHAFAGRLLRTFPEEAGVDPAFSVAEPAEVGEAIDRAWARWSRDEFAQGAPNQARWKPVLDALPWASVVELAFALADFEDIPADPGALSAGSRAAMDRMIAGLEICVGKATAKLKKPIAAATQAEAALRLLKAARDAGWKPPAQPDDTFEGSPSKSYASAGWDDADGEALKSGWNAAKAWNATRVEAAEAVRLLAGFAETHRTEALAAGRLSFNALLTLARDLVRSHPHLARRFEKHRFLVDEFQDTDERQAEIVLRLASPPAPAGTDWRALHPRPGALFVVGDPKQSIYAWRGADLGVYDAVCEQLSRAGALPRELADNFRSQPAIIAAANKVFAAAFTQEPGIQAPPTDLVAARPVKDLSGRILRLRTAPDGDGAAANARSEAQAIANWIAENRGKLRIEVDENDTQLDKPMRFRDIAILLRQTTWLPEYLRALRERRIPYVVTREQHFYEAQEIRDATNLLLALVRPDDAMALAGVMRSPVGGLTFDEIQAVGHPDWRKNAPGPAGDLFSRMRDLRSQALRLPVAEAVDLILDESGLRAAAAASAHGEQALANLDKLSSLAARLRGAEGTLATFADRLGRRLMDTEREAESPLAEPDDEVVRVSTVHGAKGLEWPVVILAGMHVPRRGGRQAATLISGVDGFAANVGGATTPSWAPLADRARRRAEAEDVRLFYVACTRAREALILSRAGTGQGAFLPMVPAGVFDAEEADADSAKALSAIPGVPMPPPEEKEKWLARRAEWEKAMKLPAIDSPSGLMHREDGGARTTGHTWESRSSTEVGIVVHRVLERWNFGGDDLDAALLRATVDLRGAARDVASAKAKELLTSFFASDDAHEIKTSTILGREVPFSMPLHDGRCIVGTMDVVFEKEGKLHVRDYKTGGENPKYETQQQVYVAAMKKLFPGREVEFRFLYLK